MNPRVVLPILGVAGSLTMMTLTIATPLSELANFLASVGNTLLLVLTPSLGSLLALRVFSVMRRRSKSGCSLLYEITINTGSSLKESLSRDLEILRQLTSKRSSRGRRVNYAVILRNSDAGTSRIWLAVASDDDEACTSEEAFLEDVRSTLLTALDLRKIAKFKENILIFMRGIGDNEAPIEADKAAQKLLLQGMEFMNDTATLEILLGTSLDNGRLVGLSEDDVLRHVLIVGSTGSGKTTTAATIVRGINSKFNDKYRIIILDWNGEYAQVLKRIDNKLKFRVLPASKAPVNPFVSGNGGSLEYVIEILDQVLELSAPQSHLLMKIIMEGKPRSLTHLVSLIAGYTEDSFWSREVKLALLRRLEPLISSSNRRFFEGRSAELSEWNGITIIDLSEVISTRYRCLYTLFLLKILFDKAYYSKMPLNLIVVIDEAHNVLRAHVELISKLIAESRKYGMSFIIITQSISNIPAQILVNTNTIISHSLKSPNDKKTLLGIVNLPKRVHEALDKLAVGEAVVISPSNSTPIIVKIHPQLHSLQAS